MGMHYYVINDELEVRIGKSSLGWQFLFNGYKDLNLNSKSDWVKYLKKNKDFIFTEEDLRVSYDEINKLIELKSKNKKNRNHYDEVKKDGMLDESRTIKDKEGYTILYDNYDVIYKDKNTRFEGININNVLNNIEEYVSIQKKLAKSQELKDLIERVKPFYIEELHHLVEINASFRKLEKMSNSFDKNIFNTLPKINGLENLKFSNEKELFSLVIKNIDDRITDIIDVKIK